MNSFTLLYLFYIAKLGSQAGIYFIWLKDSSSETIAFITAAVAVLAIVPFFHVIVHILSAKPFSNSAFIAYLCFSFLLAILWYRPTQDGEQRVLAFALVTTFDLLAFFLFLFKKQISHWHNILISDIEHLKTGSVDDPSVTLAGRGNGQELDNHFRRDVSGSINTLRLNRSVVSRPSGPANDGRGFSQMEGIETSGRLAGAEMAMRGPSNIGWNTSMVRPVDEGGAMEEGRTDLELGHQERNRFFIDLGAKIDGFQTSYPSAFVGTSADIHDMHPYFRSQLVSPNGFQTPKEALSPKRTSMQDLHQV